MESIVRHTKEIIDLSGKIDFHIRNGNVRLGEIVKLGFIKKTKEGYQASPETLGG